MDGFEAARTLLAVRSYKDTPVPDNLVRRIVEAGRQTGSEGATILGKIVALRATGLSLRAIASALP